MNYKIEIWFAFSNLKYSSLIIACWPVIFPSIVPHYTIKISITDYYVWAIQTLITIIWHTKYATSMFPQAVIRWLEIIYTLKTRFPKWRINSIITYVQRQLRCHIFPHNCAKWTSPSPTFPSTCYFWSIMHSHYPFDVVQPFYTWKCEMIAL